MQVLSLIIKLSLSIRRKVKRVRITLTYLSHTRCIIEVNRSGLQVASNQLTSHVEGKKEENCFNILLQIINTAINR